MHTTVIQKSLLARPVTVRAQMTIRTRYRYLPRKSHSSCMALFYDSVHLRYMTHLRSVMAQMPKGCERVSHISHMLEVVAHTEAVLIEEYWMGGPIPCGEDHVA